MSAIRYAVLRLSAGASRSVVAEEIYLDSRRFPGITSDSLAAVLDQAERGTALRRARQLWPGWRNRHNRQAVTA